MTYDIGLSLSIKSFIFKTYPFYTFENKLIHLKYKSLLRHNLIFFIKYLFCKKITVELTGNNKYKLTHGWMYSINLMKCRLLI